MFSITCLIQVKGKMFNNFENEWFPKIYAGINDKNTEPNNNAEHPSQITTDTNSNAKSGNGSSDHFAEEDAINAYDKITDKNENNQMIEHTKLADLNKELDFLTSDNRSLRESISLLDKS